MSDIKNCNLVSKLLLRCYNVREGEKSLIASCHTSGRKIEGSEEYAPSVWFDVIIPFDVAPSPDDLALEDWPGTTFEVSGNIRWDGYISKKTGEPAAGYKVFADEVGIHDWNVTENGDGKGGTKKKTYGPKSKK